jgi:DNA-binding XRE family transcriptional regulator
MKTFFHRKLIHRREALGMTQEEMAERLAMANRTYVYLDHGKTCCSGLTLALFLIYACEDPVLFLEELRYALEQSNSFAA